MSCSLASFSTFKCKKKKKYLQPLTRETKKSHLNGTRNENQLCYSHKSRTAPRRVLSSLVVYNFTLKLRIHHVPYTYSVSNESLETCLQLYKERPLFIHREIIRITFHSEHRFVQRTTSCRDI